MKHWLQTEWDYASWSESTMESAIMGTRRGVRRAARAAHRHRHRPHHLRALQYEKEQVEAVAKEIIPRLQEEDDCESALQRHEDRSRLSAVGASPRLEL